jgi:gliding motility-associated-like protein
MNRTLYSGLLALVCLFFYQESKAQSFAFWCSPNLIFNPGPTCISCYTAGGISAGANVVNQAATATSNTWVIQSPSTGTCTGSPTFTCTSPACGTINITYPCCGVYTINGFAVNGTVSPPAIVGNSSIEHTVVCPTSASVNVNTPTICTGSGATLTANTGTAWTWVSPTGTLTQTSNPIIVTPTVNTTYTVYAITAQGCPVTATAAVFVQSATVVVSPAQQTMCLGSQICFTASAGAINNASTTPGTVTTSIQWFEPGNNTQFATGVTACTTAAAGLYTAVVTHTGAAGTCTTSATASVTIGTSINVSISVNPSATVCPGQQFTLTGVSIQTAANQYTWTTTPPTVQFVGNPRITSSSINRVYQVDVDYFGCPGTATIGITMATLTPSATVSSASICPGTSFTMTASGGTTYTYRYLGTNGTSVPGALIPPANTTSNQAAHTPTGFPAHYSVAAFGGGCSGAYTFAIARLFIQPTVAVSSPSICPGTAFTMTAGNVGSGVSYTFEAGYAVTGPPCPNCISTGPTSVVAHNPGTGNLNYTNPTQQTYTIWADSAGCTGNTVVTIYPLTMTPTLTPSSPSICPQSTVKLTASGGQSGIPEYTFYANYNTGNPGNTLINSPATSNSVIATITTALVPPKSFTVLVDSTGCKGMATITVGLLNLSTNLKLYVTNQVGGVTHTVATMAQPSVCPNTNFTLNATGGSGTNYTLTAPSGNTLVFQTPFTATHVLSASGLPGTYTIQADSSRCVGTNTLEVRRLTLATTLSTNPGPSVCKGVPVVLTAGGGSTTIFSFGSMPPGAGQTLTPITLSTTANTTTATPGPTSTINYVVLADSAGCIGSATTQVTIAPDLVLIATASSPTVCSGTAVTLSVTGPSNASYSWAAVTGTVSTALTGMLPYSTASAGVVDNPTVTTDYVVTGLDPAGCTGTAVVTVSINPTASLTLVLSPQNQTICPSPAINTVTLSASGAISYTWSPSSSLQPSAFVATVVASPSVTTTYTVIGTNNAGCYGVATISVHVGTIPNLQNNIVATAHSVCPGFTSTLTAFGAQSYTWAGSTFTGAILQQSIAVGQGTYQVYGSNGGTCVDSATFVVGPAPALILQLTASSGTTCISSNFPKFSKPVVLNASGASNYVWLPYNSSVMTYSLGPSTTVRPPATTQYTVIGNTSICSGTAMITVTVIPQFTMNVVPPLPAMCFGDSLNLRVVNVGTNAVGPASAFSYSWAEAENAPPISISPSNLQSTVMVFPQNTTTYSVEVGDSRKCMSVPRLVTVTVFPRPVTAIAIPTINNVPTNTLCFVGPNPGPPDVVLSLNATNLNPNLQFGIVPTYTWLNPYKPPYNGILTPPNNPAIVVSGPIRVPGLVTYSVISGYNGIPGCFRMDTVSIRVIDCRPVREIKFTTAEQLDTICSRDCITFMNLTDTMAGGPQKVTWTFQAGNPPTSTDAQPMVCYNLPGRYSVILSVANPYPILEGGSKVTQGYLNYVRVVDVPNITIVPPGQLRSDTVIRFGTEVRLSGTGGLTYQWSPNYNISSITSGTVDVKPWRTTQYILTGYNSKHCASSDTINVIVIDDCGEMFVPTAFSPNGDGHNDTMFVRGICLEKLTFMIFNRWGEKVFETNDQRRGWDGTYKGQPMNTGVFVYRLEGVTYDRKAFSRKGNITLIR